MISRLTFGGIKRQESFIEQFSRLDSESQQVLGKIYTVAHGSPSQGDHVVLTMAKALEHPGIMKLAIYNIVLRLSLQSHKVRHNTAKAAHLQECLDDFHKALDTFFLPRVIPVQAPLPPAAADKKKGETFQKMKTFKTHTEPYVQPVLSVFRKPKPPAPSQEH